MKSTPAFTLVILALTTLGSVGVAWSQYRELIELRAAAMNPDERADWQRRAWELESRNRALQDELATLEAGIRRESDPALAEMAPAEPEGGRTGIRGERGPGGPRQQLHVMRELANKPEVQALLRVQQTAAIDARYAALFRQLNLPPEQIDRLKGLIAERQTTIQDVLAAARDQGLNPRSDPEGFRKLIADAQAEADAGIKSIVGDSGFSQMQNYEQTLPQRSLVSEIQQRLSYTDTPLSAAQADQLVQILADNTPHRRAGGNPPIAGTGMAGLGRPGAEFGGLLSGAFGGGFIDAGGRAVASVPITGAAVAQAQTILAPQQSAVLQQIQQQQQGQQQLQRLLRESMAPSR